MFSDWFLRKTTANIFEGFVLICSPQTTKSPCRRTGNKYVFHCTSGLESVILRYTWCAMWTILCHTRIMLPLPDSGTDNLAGHLCTDIRQMSASKIFIMAPAIKQGSYSSRERHQSAGLSGGELRNSWRINHYSDTVIFLKKLKHWRKGNLHKNHILEQIIRI